MSYQSELPGAVIELMGSGLLTEFVTLSAAGVPIDTPVLYFPGDGLASLDVATGLSYPAKAERARRNPKVGLTIEGRPDEPVIAIAGTAAVRDTDLQANAIRYIAEAGHTLPGNPDWSVARRSVWYWTRMIVEITPARIYWWDDAAAMDRPPHRWDAPPGTIFPSSDPAPFGAPSKAPQWEQKQGWRELAAEGLKRGRGGHLSLVDAEGYPMAIRAKSIALTGEGFAIDMPRGLPWPLAGQASLTFQGLESFVGTVEGDGGTAQLRVERALPILPTVSDMTQLWDPTPDLYDKMMGRLRHETERRGVPIPIIPKERPEPTEGYRRRMARGKPAGPRPVDPARTFDTATS
jgi:hypothetical protein